MVELVGTQYYVFDSKSLQDLIDTVNKHIKEGWELQGGVSVCCPTIHEYHYYQAMTQKLYKYTYGDEEHGSE